jgi:hypothetical protein
MQKEARMDAKAGFEANTMRSALEQNILQGCSIQSCAVLLVSPPSPLIRV